MGRSSVVQGRPEALGYWAMAAMKHPLAAYWAWPMFPMKLEPEERLMKKSRVVREELRRECRFMMPWTRGFITVM